MTWSSTECITQPVPATPTNLQATDGEILDVVNITWDEDPMADWYNVYRNTIDDEPSKTLLESNVTREAAADYGTVNYDTYFYWVEGCNVNGCSAPAGSEAGYSAGLHFWDDFETNNLTKWTRFNDGNGFLYTCGQAAIHGSYGACVERGTNDKRKQLIDDSPVNEITFNARFNFDINNLSMTTGERFRFMQLKMDALRPAFIVLKYDSGVYSIQLNSLLDDFTKVKTGWVVLPNAPTTIEVEWQQSSGESANDGFARLYLNGVLQDELPRLDNFHINITSFRMGFTSRLAGKSISGIFYIDDVATSNAGYIGLP